MLCTFISTSISLQNLLPTPEAQLAHRLAVSPATGCLRQNPRLKPDLACGNVWVKLGRECALPLFSFTTSCTR